MELQAYIKPNVSEGLAIELTRRIYGLEVISIQKFVSFDDQNFHIVVSKEHQNPHLSKVLEDGYTLKITNVNRSEIPDHFDSMHAAMTHLNAKGLNVPVPVKTLEGHTWKMEKVPLKIEDPNLEDDKMCGIHLLTFLPGIPISKVPYTPDLLYQWGLLLAKYHHAVEDLKRPSLMTKEFLWSLKYIPDLPNYMEGMEASKAELVTRVLKTYPAAIEKNIDKLPKGIIHGDFNENNLLVVTPESGSPYVDGILDFEDIYYDAYVWDIGVMMAYSLLDCNTMDPLDGAGLVLAGYLSHRSLSELELSLIKMCIQYRLCQSLVLCGYSYRTDPSNTYLLSSSKTGWNRLEQICNTSNEDLLRKWKAIQAPQRNTNNSISQTT